MLWLFKKLGDGQSPKQENLTVNFSHAVFSLLDFLILQEGTDRLSWNISKELLHYAA